MFRSYGHITNKKYFLLWAFPTSIVQTHKLTCEVKNEQSNKAAEQHVRKATMTLLEQNKKKVFSQVGSDPRVQHKHNRVIIQRKFTCGLRNDFKNFNIPH